MTDKCVYKELNPEYSIPELAQYVKFILYCYNVGIIGEVFPKHSTTSNNKYIYFCTENSTNTILREVPPWSVGNDARLIEPEIVMNRETLFNIRYYSSIDAYNIDHHRDTVGMPDIHLKSFNLSECTDEYMFQLSCTDVPETVLYGIEFLKELKRQDVVVNFVLYYENFCNLLKYHMDKIEAGMLKYNYQK